MSLLQRFKDSIKQQHLFSPKDKLLLAVSGGVDSVVLCELCHQAGYDFTIAQSGVSAKASGNRCVVFLDTKKHRQDVLMMYSKGDLPKNVGETMFIRQMVQEQFPDLWAQLD